MVACFDVLRAQPKTRPEHRRPRDELPLGWDPGGQLSGDTLSLLNVGFVGLQGRVAAGAGQAVSLQTGLEGARKIQPQRASAIGCGKRAPLPAALRRRRPGATPSSDYGKPQLQCGQKKVNRLQLTSRF